VPKAINIFDKTIERSRNLIALYDRLNANHGADPPDDLVRASITLAVAGMDAFFTSRFSDSLVVYLKTNTPSDGLVDVLSKAGLDTKQALVLLGMSRPYRRIRTLVEQYLSNYTTQRFDVINQLFLVYNITHLCKNSIGLAKRKNLRKRVESLVQRRHRIVHEGDYNSHGKLRKIDPIKIRNSIDDLELFVKKAEELIATILPS
jgi:RiboL-PSP-HEPN